MKSYPVRGFIGFIGEYVIFLGIFTPDFLGGNDPNLTSISFKNGVAPPPHSFFFVFG